MLILEMNLDVLLSISAVDLLALLKESFFLCYVVGSLPEKSYTSGRQHKALDEYVLEKKEE